MVVGVQLFVGLIQEEVDKAKADDEQRHYDAMPAFHFSPFSMLVFLAEPAELPNQKFIICT